MRAIRNAPLNPPFESRLAVDAHYSCIHIGGESTLCWQSKRRKIQSNFIRNMCTHVLHIAYEIEMRYNNPGKTTTGSKRIIELRVLEASPCMSHVWLT
jgi:hypothetical protein